MFSSASFGDVKKIVLRPARWSASKFCGCYIDVVGQDKTKFTISTTGGPEMLAIEIVAEKEFAPVEDEKAKDEGVPF